MTHPLETHEFEPVTKFCLHCGVAAADALDSMRRCSPKNVIGISHLLAYRKFQAAGIDLK